MILLKHKPLVLQHFNSDGLYNIGPSLSELTTGKITFSTDSKFGTRCINTEEINHSAWENQVARYSDILHFNIPDYDKNFSISCWMKPDFKKSYAKYGHQIILFMIKFGETLNNFGWPWGDTKNAAKGIFYWSMYLVILNSDGSVQENIVPGKSFNVTSLDNTWIHFEIDRDENGMFYAFMNGSLAWSVNDSRFCKNYNINNNTCYLCTMDYSLIDELLVTQHCLHTTDFTPPTEPYWWSNGNKIYDEKNNQYTMSKGNDEIAVI